MNVLYGLYRADEGEIELDGEVQHFTGPGDAMAAGIGMVRRSGPGVWYGAAGSRPRACLDTEKGGRRNRRPPSVVERGGDQPR